jgi:hypothetical protein
MYANPFEPLFGRPTYQFVQLLDMGMDITVGKKTDKMYSTTLTSTFTHGIPYITVKNPAGVDGPVYKTGPLFKDAARAKGVVPYLTVSHISIARKPYEGAVSVQLNIEIRCKESIESRGLGQIDCIAFISSSLTDSIHDNEKERTLSTRK